MSAPAAMLWVVLLAGPDAGPEAAAPSDSDGGVAVSLLDVLKPSVLELVEVTPAGEVGGNGTGFIVSSDGLLVTNHHVIEHLTHLEARTAGGQVLQVEGLLVDDEEQDLAVLKLKGSGFTPIPIGDSDQVKPGDRVAMLACPLGLGWTYGQGIVSAVRPNGLPPELLKEQEPLPGDKLPLLQLELTSGGGASGGPIVDLDGRLIGVMRAGYGQVSAFSIAIPSKAVAERIARARKAEVRPLHPWPWRNLAGSFVFFVGLAAWWVYRGRKRGSA